MTVKLSVYRVPNLPTGGGQHIPLDLTDEQSIESAVNAINQIEGQIVLINCAGVMAREDELTMAELDRVFRTNVTGVILLEQLLFDQIKSVDGEIINVISTSALRGDVAQPIYSSSKWALRGFTQSLQARLKGSKARAISFVPGGFISKMAEKIGRTIPDPENWMPVEDVSQALYDVIKAPKTYEVSEIVLNRK